MSDAEILQQAYNKNRARRKLCYRVDPEDMVRVINEIRYKRLIEGIPVRTLAKEYDMDINVISRIGAGKAFKDVPLDDRMRQAIEALGAGGKS